MISVIIPIAGNQHTANLDLVSLVLKQQTYKAYELILVEQRKRKDQSIYINFPCDKYISVVNPYNDLFHRNWLMNVGANMAVGNKLLFMDADIFFGCNYLQKIYDYKKPWFVAWSKLIYLDMVNTNVLLTDKKPSTVENYDKDAMWSDPLCAAGGSVCVDREWFYNLFGGNNENYFGWGAEDNDSACRAMTIMKEFCRLRYSIYHLHHDDDRVDNCGKCSSKNNQHQWWITQHHSSEITKRIIHTKIGQTTGPTLVKIRDLRP